MYVLLSHMRAPFESVIPIAQPVVQWAQPHRLHDTIVAAVRGGHQQEGGLERAQQGGC